VMAKPESNMVAVGTKYRADLFLASSSSQVSPEMAINGSKIEVVDGFGKVEFTVTPGTYDSEGKVKKTFEATILYNDSTYKQTIEYFAVKPVIQIQSASVNALYLNCGNELNVQVPALGTSYNPTFSGRGADFIPDRNRRGFVMVIPSGTQEVTLTVSSSGNAIGSQTFKVRGIPKPDILMQVAGKAVDEKVGLPQPPRTLTLTAVPDKSFAEFLPNDARYRVLEWEVMLARGRRQVQSMVVNGPDANISALAGLARPGDRIVATVRRVARMNFRNNQEDVNMGTIVKQFTIGD
ncbi:MAG TPA: GldM family protein, partial [Cyclobacteriaceae bacterium]|nr:GldM family protein [Cyclobacteriaceae bacterium]